MNTSNIPSFFKSIKPKSFNFKPRYYDERKQRIDQLEKGVKPNIRFNRNYTNKKEKTRKMKIVFLIILLSLLAYKVIIN